MEALREKAIVEAVVFASRGITLKRLSRVTGIGEERLKEILEDLREEYSKEEHGVELREVEGRYRFYTKKELSEYVEKVTRRKYSKLNEQQMEVVVIIAMNGPLTRREIEEMRGKDSSAVLRSLREMGVVSRKRKGSRVLYDLTRGFKQSSIYEEILSMVRGGADG